MEDVIKGEIVGYGCVYFGDKKLQKKYWQNLSPKERKDQDYFRLIEAPKRLAELQEKLKVYQIKDDK